MRALRRWAPWRAEWDEKKQKYTKIPHRAARPEHGLSNKNATGWVTFEQAMAAYQANSRPNSLRLPDGTPFALAGVGYLMTGPHGITGVDLDHCRDPATGKLDDWAAELVAQLDTYTEVSPSGTGLHAMVAGDVAEDWTNHERGIEVYGGNEARFLCVTGQRVPGSRDALRAPPPFAMAKLQDRYRKAPTKAEVEDLHLPDLLPVEFLPALSELELPPHASNFLTSGPAPGDRSRQLFAAAIALSQAGLAPDEVLSILEDNEYAMEVALDHRRQDYDKALRYLWKQCQQGQARGEQLRQDGFDAFDVLDEVDRDAALEDELDRYAKDAERMLAALVGPPGTNTTADDFDVIEDDGTVAAPASAPAGRKLHFPLMEPDKFLKRKPMSWIVRGVLPRAALAVIYGASTAGKTFFTWDLVASIARGVEWCGRRVTKGRGVYIVAEGSEGFRNRVQAYCEFHGVEPGDLAVWVMPAAPALMDKAQVIELIKDLQTLGPLDFVVVDTYARVMVGGNENDAQDTSLMVAHCARIHKHTGALVILVHHSGVNTEGRARGSSVLKAAADVEVEVIRTREYRAARVAKMKDGDDSGEFRFQLPIVELGTNEDGDAITSCVVSHLDAPADGYAPDTAGGLKGTNAAVFEALVATIDLVGEVTFADAVEAGISHLPAPEEGKRDRRRDVVIRALDKLIELGKAKIEDNYLVVG
jgi:RecA/RadA recombinase